MKKLFLSALLVLAALSACQKNEPSAPVTKGEVLYATIEDVASTRTVKDENNNIRWSEGDQIIAFMNSTLGVKYQVLPSSVGETSASFEEVSTGGLNAGTELDHIVAYYPYSSSVKIARSGDNYTLNAVLPSEQIYASESFGNGAFPMIAVSSTNNLTFKNICGAMKLQLKGTQKVASIKVEGKNNERLSGAAAVTAYAEGNKPAIAMSSDASTSVVLDCGSGVQLNETEATEFIVTLPPTLFTKGFVVTISDAAGNRSLIETDKSNEVRRSSVLVMPAVILESGDIIPQERDYVDEYGINHGQGIKIGQTVWAPVNCGYHATDFKYGKLYQWGRKYGQGFDGDLYVNGNYHSQYTDVLLPIMVSAPAYDSEGSDVKNANSFYTSTINQNWDWLNTSNAYMWNSNDEVAPKKTEYDPCPEGWRVPSYAELYELIQNPSEWSVNAEGQEGISIWGPDASEMFLPASGARWYDGKCEARGLRGIYFSSLRWNPFKGYAWCLTFSRDEVCMNSCARANGISVRCVQDVSDSTIPSTPDAISLTENGTANSYMVSTAGLYTFVPTKGNSNESVGAIASVEVLWESFGTDVAPNVGDLIKNVSYKDGEVVFQTADTFKEGNAVIAAKDACGKILWSWHIWLTDEPLDQVYYNNAGTMMDRNLGATSATPGDVGALGLFYQWGRKDPFLGSQSVTCIDTLVKAQSTLIWPLAVESNKDTGTIEFTIANPTTFVSWNGYNRDWYYTGTVDADEMRWDDKKTMYDPCPLGWRVPSGGDNGLWVIAAGQKRIENYECDTVNRGFNLSGLLSSELSVWFPFAGNLSCVGGGLASVGDAGYCWTTSRYDFPNASGRYAFDVYQDGLVAPIVWAYSSRGNSVRCCKDLD